MKTLLLALALAIPAAHAQTVSPVLEVQRLAPQLVAFAGGETNFANLVNGLALGVPVTLTTPTTGGPQAVTFTPAGTMSSLQIAQLLESARQSLIARGVATPTAQQLGATLTGGSLVTPIGSAPVNALVNTTNAQPATAQSPAVAIQNATSVTAATNAAAAAGATVPGARNTSDSLLPRGVSDTPPLPVPGSTAPAQGPTAIGATPSISISPTVPVAPAATGGTAPRGSFGQAGR